MSKPRNLFWGDYDLNSVKPDCPIDDKQTGFVYYDGTYTNLANLQHDLDYLW